jgi:hypothetical protein
MQAELSQPGQELDPKSKGDTIIASRPTAATELPIQLKSEEFKTAAAPTASPAEMKAILIAALGRVLENEQQAERAKEAQNLATLNEAPNRLLEEVGIPQERIIARALELGIPKDVIESEIDSFNARASASAKLTNKIESEAAELGLPSNSGIKEIERERLNKEKFWSGRACLRDKVNSLLNSNSPIWGSVLNNGLVIGYNEGFDGPPTALKIDVSSVKFPDRTIAPTFIGRLFGRTDGDDIFYARKLSFTVEQPTDSPAFNEIIDYCKENGVKIEVSWSLLSWGYQAKFRVPTGN